MSYIECNWVSLFKEVVACGLKDEKLAALSRSVTLDEADAIMGVESQEVV